MPERRPAFADQLDDWERATRERGTEPARRETSREPSGRSTRGAGAAKKQTPRQRSERQKQIKAFEAVLRPANAREQQLDRLENEMQRKSRELAGSVAGAAAGAILTSQKKSAKPAKSKKWEEGSWGVGFGNSWADDEAMKAANKALGRPEKAKPTDAELKNPRSKFVTEFWKARNTITKRLAGLREMNCLTMMKEPLQAYVRAAGRLTQDNNEREDKLGEAINKAKDARSVDHQWVPEARGTVLLEELRKQFGFETVHVDAVPKDPAKYWNNTKTWNYSSDADAHYKDRRLPKLEQFRKVTGADSGEQVDVSVGVDHFVKLDKKMTAESRKWWEVLNETEFAVGVADLGFHTFAISRGFVYEVHWDRGPDNPTLTEKRTLKDFFEPNDRKHGFGWSSGIIAVPPEALPKKAE